MPAPYLLTCPVSRQSCAPATPVSSGMAKSGPANSPLLPLDSLSTQL